MRIFAVLLSEGRHVYVEATSFSIGQTGSALFWIGEKDIGDNFVCAFSPHHWRLVSVFDRDVPDADMLIRRPS